VESSSSRPGQLLFMENLTTSGLHDKVKFNVIGHPGVARLHNGNARARLPRLSSRVSSMPPRNPSLTLPSVGAVSTLTGLLMSPELYTTVRLEYVLRTGPPRSPS
jgi:hypothetical protein